MAAVDYRSCDVCGGKAFYDADLNYETGEKVDGKWVYPDSPYRIAGEDQGQRALALGYVGDWAVICTKCAKTHCTAILPRVVQQPPQAEPDKSVRTWCECIAGIIGTYLKEPDDSKRIPAIAGIIERRLWTLPKQQPPQGEAR